MSSVTAPQRLIKQPAEVLKMGVEFTKLLSSGETLSSSVITVDSTTIVTTTGTISGSQVQFTVSSGIDGRAYRFEVQVVTSTSNTREADCMLDVRDQ